MHEMGIAQSILDAVSLEIQKRPGAIPTKIGVRIGELAGVNPEALDFGFSALLLETKWPALRLDIKFLPRSQRCLVCGTVFPVKNLEYECVACRSAATTFLSGDELELEYLEIEDGNENDKRPAAIQSS